MMSADTLPLRVGATKRLEGALPADANEIQSVEALSAEFLTEITVSDRYLCIVDGFPLLFYALTSLRHLQGHDKFVLGIGEGLVLRGNRMVNNDKFALNVLDGQEVLSQFEMPTALLLVALARMISDLVTSIERADIDVYGAVRRFYYQIRDPSHNP